MLHPARDYNTVHEIAYHATPLSYKQFFDHFLEPNLPVIVGPDLTKHWRARQQWVSADTGKPNFGALREQLCQEPVQVPVADCHTRDFTDQKRSTMDLKTFLDEWEANSLANVPSRTYLKDFHFVRTFPGYHAYDTPEIFRDDWMNEFWTRRKDMDDDYRFVYCGGDGTFTPFHADVYRSVQVVGMLVRKEGRREGGHVSSLSSHHQMLQLLTTETSRTFTCPDLTHGQPTSAGSKSGLSSHQTKNNCSMIALAIRSTTLRI